MDFGVLLVIAAVLLGCMIQRTSGMGVGLAVSPALVLVIGPVAGVLLTNVTAVVSAALMTIAVRPDIDWTRFARIAPVVVIGSIPAALLVRAVGPGWLEIIIGLVLLIAVAGTTLLPTLPQVPATPAGMVAGVLGGFLNTAVGVASPAYLIYARATSWDHRPFAATLQPLFLTMGLVSIITKSVVGLGSNVEMPSWPIIVAVIGAVPLGVALGGKVAAKIPVVAARRLAVTIVVMGAGGTVLRGLTQMLPA